LLIVVRHYLARYQGLLVLQRSVTDSPPLLLQQDCLPFPEAAQQARVPFDTLTADERQTLLTYYDLTAPGVPPVSAPVATDGTDGMVHLPGGTVQSPTGETVIVEAYTIDAQVVTNAAFQQFIQAQGYSTESYWSAAGWGWREGRDQRQPSYWEDQRFNAPEQPVVGVTWYEADAYCRWAGKALPSETQWDQACQFAAEQGNGTLDFPKEVLEWTSTAHGEQGLGLRSKVASAGVPQAACGSSHVLFPGITANFIGFRCQAAAP
jgi:formylglycine-generating enzyme required for sulfatase activity